MATPKKSKHTIEIKDEGNGLFLRKTKEISESLLLAINNGKNGELDKEVWERIKLDKINARFET